MNVPASAGQHQGAAPVRATFEIALQFFERHRHQLWRWLVVAFCFVSSCAHAQSRITLGWDRNTETNIAGYRLYYGTVTRVYTNTVNVGNVTTATVSNLVTGVTYRFAVTAFNTAGAESDYSAEIAYTVTNNATPNVPPTLGAIANLAVNEDSGPHLVLLSGISSGGENQPITVTASTTNTTLISGLLVNYLSPRSTGTVALATATNAFGTARVDVTVSDGIAQVVRSFNVTVNSINDAPTLTSIANRTIAEDTSTGPVAFTIGDVETSAASLSLSAVSSNLTLVPNANIVFGGVGANRTVQVTPAPNQFGIAPITISVSDGTLSATRTFQLTVTASNDPPTIAALPAAIVPPQTITALAPVVIADIDTPASSLVVTGTSSDTNVLPNANILLGATGLSRTLSVHPLRTGVTTVTLRVSDGLAQSSQAFVLTVTNATDLVTMRASYNAAFRGLTISWDSKVGGVYRVLSRSSLNDTNWVNVTGDFAATSTTTTWTDLSAGRQPSGFYIIEMRSP